MERDTTPPLNQAKSVCCTCCTCCSTAAEAVSMDFRKCMRRWARVRSCTRTRVDPLSALLVLLAACAPLCQVQSATAGRKESLPSVCASMCSASGPSLTLAVAGATQSFTITARDDSGIPLTNDAGSAFIVRLGDRLVRANVRHSTGAATYVGSYDVSASGTDRLSLMLAKCELAIENVRIYACYILKNCISYCLYL